MERWRELVSCSQRSHRSTGSRERWVPTVKLTRSPSDQELLNAFGWVTKDTSVVT